MSKESKEFTFKEVTTLPLSTTFLIVLAVIGFYSFAYYMVMRSYFKLSFILIAFALIVITIVTILKRFTSTVKFTFDSDSICIFYDQQSHTYQKKDVKALYSVNYLTSDSSKIAFELVPATGKSLYISDIEFADRKDAEKNKVLKDFLATFCRELHFAGNTEHKPSGISRIGKSYFTKVV